MGHVGEAIASQEVLIPIYLPSSYNDSNIVIGEAILKEDNTLVITFNEGSSSGQLIGMLREPWLVGLALQYLEAAVKDMHVHVAG